MKLKNVTTLEKHFEKLLIGVTLAILGAVAYFYVLNPTTVKIDGKDVEPQMIDAVINQKAQQLHNALNSKELPKELEKLTVTKYMKAFSDKYSERLLPEDQVKVPFGPIAIFPDGIDRTRKIKPYFTPTIPAPEMIAQRADLGSIDPTEVANNAELARILPAAAPFDTTWVSVVGRFDMAAMIKSLSQPDNENFQAIPVGWWNGFFGILDVQLERQELNPQTQEWSKAILIEPMPGAISFRYLPTDVNTKDAANYNALMVKHQLAIQRPQFYVVEGKPWVPPEPDDDKPLGNRKEDLKRDIRKKRGQIDQTQRQIDKTKIPAPATVIPVPVPQLPPPPTGGVRTPPSTGIPPTFTPPGAHRPVLPPPVRTTGRDKQIAILTEKLTKLQSELRAMEIEYQKMTGETITPQPGVPGPGIPPVDFGAGVVGPGGVVQPGTRVVPGTGQVPGAAIDFGTGRIVPGGAQPVPLVLESLGGAKPDLWVNDMSVLQGKTYRYRLRVVLYNPFYHKGKDEKANKSIKLYKDFAMTSDWTDWGKPITIERMKHFFLVNATPNGQARIDVWRFYKGDWHSHEFPVRAGDPVGGPFPVKIDKEDVSVDFFAGAYVVDMDTMTIPGIKPGDPPKKTTRVLFLVDDDMPSRRLDLDKVDPKRAELRNLQIPSPAAPGVGAGGPTISTTPGG